MPLRIKPCIESTILHSSNVAKPALSSRRELHSAFFQHGAAALHLPFWWEAIITPMSQMFVENASKKQNANPNTVVPGVLDFLYPRRTKALIRRLSRNLQVQGYQSAKRSLSRFYSSTTRADSSFAIRSLSKFASSARQASSIAHDDADSTNLSPSPDLQTVLATVRLALQNLAWADKRSIQLPSGEIKQRRQRKRINAFEKSISKEIGQASAFVRAWEAYSQLSDEHKTTEAKIVLANYMSFSGLEEDSIRLLFLTDSSEFDQKYTFWRAIVIHCFAGNIAQAGQVHDAAKRQGVKGYIGSDLLLAHALKSKNWTIALQVSTAVFTDLGRSPDQKTVQAAIEELWAITRQLDCLNDRAAEFITYAYERLDVEHFIFKAFIQHFIHAVFSLIPPQSASLAPLLQVLRQYKIDQKSLLQYVLENIIKAIKGGVITIGNESLDTLGTAWHAYKRHCQIGEINTPLIMELLEVLTSRRGVTDVQQGVARELIMDIISSSTEHNVELPYSAMVALMDRYSILGDADLVQSLDAGMNPPLDKVFTSTRSSSDRVLDIQRLKAVVQVYAITGDITRAELLLARFTKNNPKFKIHYATWNALLMGYRFSRNLGAMFDIVFKRMPKHGCIPTKKQLEILVRGCGWSGNVPMLLALLGYAEREGVTVTNDMLQQMAVAHARGGKFESADAIIDLLEESQVKNVSNFRANIWLSILSGAAQQKDFASADAIFSKILASDQQLTTAVFSPMIALFTSRKYTDEAAKLVFEVMPQKNVHVTAHQLGMLVRGYFYEERFDDAMATFDKIVEKGDGVDVTARVYRLATLCLVNRGSPNFDEDSLKSLDILLDSTSDSRAFLRDKPEIWHRNVDDVYFFSLLELFGEVQAWDIVNYLQHWYIVQRGHDPSMSFLKAMMKINLLGGNHKEVELLWNRSLSLISQHSRRMADHMKQVRQRASLNNGSIDATDRSVTGNTLYVAQNLALSSKSDLGTEIMPATDDPRYIISIHAVPLQPFRTEKV